MVLAWSPGLCTALHLGCSPAHHTPLPVACLSLPNAIHAGALASLLGSPPYLAPQASTPSHGLWDNSPPGLPGTGPPKLPAGSQAGEEWSQYSRMFSTPRTTSGGGGGGTQVLQTLKTEVGRGYLQGWGTLCAQGLSPHGLGGAAIPCGRASTCHFKGQLHPATPGLSTLPSI